MRGRAAWAALGVVAGAVLPVQGAINAELRADLDAPIAVGAFSFVVATAAMALVLAAALAVGGARRPRVAPLRAVPWWGWLGGLCGATYVTSVFLLIPEIGAAPTIALTVAGQQVASVLIDRHGLLRLPRRPISRRRLRGRRDPARRRRADPARLAEAAALDGAGQLDARAHADLGVDVAQVRLDRARAEDELLGDLAVRAPGRDQPGDLGLARGQRAGGRVACCARDAMAEAPELAHGLIAQAQRPEAVERALGLAERRDARRRARRARRAPGPPRGARGRA